MELKIEDLVNASELADAGVAIAVSVTAGLVVAVLTAPHSPPLIRELRRRLRALRRTVPPSRAPSTPAVLRPTLAPPPPPPAAATPLPPPPPPPTKADFLRCQPAVLAPPPEPDVASDPIERPGPKPGATATGALPALRSVSEPEEIVVRLLGPIEVGGVRLREKAVAVLAFLAVHRTASGDTLEDACWTSPSNGRSRKRLKDVVSECRSTVGIEHLPHADAGIYAVGPKVVTDLYLFDRALERADLEAGLERARHLQAALDLIRGRIFAFPSRSTPSFGWIDLENLVSHWELRIEDVARDCALLLSDAGRTRDSVMVLLRVLEVLPLNVGLTEALMTVHATAGERHAVDAVFRAHAQGLARIHGCEPDDTTVDLRADLLAAARRR